ncbi:MAG: peptide chain release factor N(5)-glutamine methyltransferase [Fimbriimonadales bacterium]|nr:peptide chain release factor N(5)-glutamine methyltransferase [Fimbriimonadales bacterium]MDW8051240.1 peptide chain release factor N(5)-glutamine methyltransferase [Armatimonadota bacterium]
MTAAQAVAETCAALRQAGIAEAQREAELLVAAALGVERAYLIAHPETPLSAQHCMRLHRWIRRRAAREPLAYITRRVWFYGLRLHIGRGALIPRPETEHLVEQFLQWAQRHEFAHTPMLVDAGTGSGAIAIACLLHAPRWLAVGIDCSRLALRIAARNRRAFKLQQRLLLVQGDWLTPLRPHSVDAVIANPPYVLPDEWDSLQPEIRLYEPRQALLVPPDDPLRPYREIAQAARRVLRSPGLLVFETSPRLAPHLASHLPAWGFAQTFTCTDYSGALRVVGATV